jgi:DNA-binding CsgD family transcriptional regulator
MTLDPPTTTGSSPDGVLERSTELAGLDALLAAVRADGRGRLALVAGEAGIGKTALVRAFCDGARSPRVLRGACDALHTPRPLGPFVDIAADTAGELEDLVAAGSAPSALVVALLRELRRRPGTILVLEDLHWADQATLDVLRMLGRRIESLPALVVGTYRDDELDRTHPLRIVLGELPAGGVDRVVLRPLSPDAVATLAGASGVDQDALHRRTAGNPFFVTEVLAAGQDGMPDTVLDAVLARAARLDPDARAVLDAVAIMPRQAELALLEALVGGNLAGLDACLASGMLRAEREAVSFRHEIARLAIEESLSPHRRLLLHRRALATGEAASGRRVDLARMAHHAEAAGDADAVLRLAPEAGDRAALLGAHREAAGQYARALRYAEGLPPARRAELLERRSYECYLTDCIPEAIEARRLALVEHRTAGDRAREGDQHRWLSRLAWFAGDNATAEDEARRAVELLEPLAPGAELAMAYSNVAQLRMLATDRDAASAWGARAIELAEHLGETEILAHALNNVGAAQGIVGGRALLERSLALALDAGLEEHVARAYTNLGASAVDGRDYPLADRHLAAGIAYCTEHDLDSWRLYMTGYRARSELDQGRWDAAAVSATSVVAHPGVAAPSRITPLVVLGRLRARRGDPDPWTPLEEALELATATGEVQRLAPVAIARAEARWLAGEPEKVDAETAAALALALEHGDRWSTGELQAWRRRAGLEDEIAPEAVAAPFQPELGAEAAAELWRALGCPYEAALTMAESEEGQRRGLRELQQLGARPAANVVARALRQRGVRDVHRGPRAATRSNPAGLTARELEVLALVAAGLRNAEIAARLFLAEKTVAHHVSAILRKLGAGTRSHAAAEASRLGILER